ncbi:MAG TPA: YciI family protein [Polyangiaceae bacterium]|nr:YciI family protein [Polyangiaceae bacterium]
MRVMVFGSGNRDTEAGVKPSDEAIAQMVKYNTELAKEGVVLDGQGLMPTSTAKRVRFEGAKRTVIDGPFAETKEVISGYWLWQVRSIDEAVEWLKRAPFDGGVEVTIRGVFTWKDPSATNEDTTMRVMVFVPGSRDSEAGVMPSAELIGKMTKFNEELVKAGVMLDGQGLKPTSAGKRVRFEGGEPTVIDGPFAESKEVIAGYQIWQVSSIDEAVEWAKRAPLESGAEVTLRPIFAPEDYGQAATP